MSTKRQTSTKRAVAWEGSQPTLMARIVDSDGDNIVQADLSAIAMRSIEKDSDRVVASAVPVVASTVFDTLQDDDRWTVDTTGYNFRYQVPSGTLPSGDTDYIVMFEFTEASGVKFYVQFELKAKESYF